MSKPIKREKDPNEKPYLEFRLCANKCLACNGCGYFWGEGNKKNHDKPATWSGPGNEGGVGRDPRRRDAFNEHDRDAAVSNTGNSGEGNEARDG
jgi:hypothetical protein